MRRQLVALVLLLVLAPPFLAEMRDSTASNRAKNIFGPMGMIAQWRGVNDTNWTKGVGMSAPGCQPQPVPVTGAGLTAMVVAGTGATWDAAFAAVQATGIRGPYSGVVTIKANIWDQNGVTAFQWILDGAPLGPQKLVQPAVSYVAVTTAWDTASLSGVHVLCAQALNAAGYMARSNGVLLNIDQTQPSIAWADPRPIPDPVVEVVLGKDRFP